MASSRLTLLELRFLRTASCRQPEPPTVRWLHAMQHIDPDTAMIGAGQAGMPLARALSAAGRPLVLFEREHPGGSCVNFGCMPSKAMIASARIAADIKWQAPAL